MVLASREHGVDRHSRGKQLNVPNAASAADRPGVIRSDERAWQGYLLAWTITPLLLFTPARNIIMTYVLPGLPAAAIWAGGWMARQRRSGRETNQWLSLGLAVTLLVAGSVAIVDVSQPGKMQQKSVKTMLAAYDQARAHPVPIPALNAPGVMLTPSDAPLIFIAFRPFSAEFYSRGKAGVVINDAEVWRRVGAGAGYVATRVADIFIASAVDVAGGEGAVGVGTAGASVRQRGNRHALWPTSVALANMICSSSPRADPRLRKRKWPLDGATS